MTSMMKFAGALAAAVSMTGYAEAATPDAMDFAHALAHDYGTLSQAEQTQGDERDAQTYACRANAAASGKPFKRIVATGTNTTRIWNFRAAIAALSHRLRDEACLMRSWPCCLRTSRRDNVQIVERERTRLWHNPSVEFHCLKEIVQSRRDVVSPTT